MTNATIEVKEWNDEIVFLHRVIMGAADRSYGIQVAKLAGLPKPVIKRANEVLIVLENKNQKSGGINQLEDLPLFSMELPENEEEMEEKAKPNPIGDKLQDELLQLNPDELTPKNALDMLLNSKQFLSKNLKLKILRKNHPKTKSFKSTLAKRNQFMLD